MPDGLYAQWKREIVVDAFAHRGLPADVAPLRTLPPGSRRRAVLTARRTGRTVTLGFHAEGSHRLIDIAECPVLTPTITRALPAIRSIAMRSIGGDGAVRATVLEVAEGLDLMLETDERSRSAGDRLALAELARTHGVQRLTVDGEVVAQHGPVELDIAGHRVAPPAGVFVQAAAPAEAMLIEAVVAAIGKAKNIADLFAGLGTFTLPLARSARVTAVDSDAAALAALASAARKATGLKPVATLTRDLFREPLARKELEPFDAVVLDPPRAGAAAQVAMLAKSAVSRVVMVSCNPATLARDARSLIEAGYHMGRVQPVDQFLWSSHVEAVVEFNRHKR